MSFRAKVYSILAIILVFAILLFCVQIVSIVFAVRKSKSRLKLGLRLVSLFMMLYFCGMFADAILKRYVWSFSSLGLLGKLAGQFPAIAIMDGNLRLSTFFIFYPLLMVALLVISVFVGNPPKSR